MGKELDIEDEKFETLLADRRHREITGTLKSIATHLSNNGDKEVVNAINKQGEKVGELVEAIKGMPKPEKQDSPQVNVEVNQDKVISSLQQICSDIVASNNRVIEALENRMLPDSFDLVKGYGGATQSVKVNYKPANKLVSKK